MPIEQVDTVREMAEITQTYTTAIAVVAVFMVIILAAFAASMWEARADRKLERDERDADRKARARLDEVRILRGGQWAEVETGYVLKDGVWKPIEEIYKLQNGQLVQA